MSGEQYSIFIKVDSSQVSVAAKSLDNLGNASDKAEVSIKRMGTSTAGAVKPIADATKAIQHMANEYRNAAGIIDSSGLGAKLGGAAKTVSAAMDSAENSTRKAAGAFDALEKTAKSVRSMFVLFVGVEIARFLRDMAGATQEAADAYTNMRSKLDIATNSQQELTQAFKESFEIANKYYSSVNDVASAYAKFNPIVVGLGRASSDTTKIVSSLSASLLISGNNTVDAAETFRQFAQAISGPKIQMEEMNTIIDSNQALWRGLQRQFPDIIAKYGSLKEAISKQAISSEMLINATIALGDEFEALAARKAPTIANAMTVLQNSFTQYIGEADGATGASSALATAILDLAQAITGVEGKGQSMAQAVGFMSNAWALFATDVTNAKIALQEMIGLQQAGTSDPEIQRLMQLGQGQIPIDQLAIKPAKPTTAPQLTPRGTDGGAKTSAREAAKEAKNALEAFKAQIAAQISAAENAERIFSAQMDSRKKRYQIEADQIKGIAELQIRATKSESMRLSIAEEAQTKIVDAINQETNLRQEVLAKEMEITQAKMDGNQQELDAADAHKLKQSERIELLTKQSELETEMAVKRQEQVQIELDAIGQIQSAERDLAGARQQANETMVKEEALRQLEIMSSNLEYAKEMATGLAQAFGEVGAAIGGMSVAMAEYEKQSATVEIARKEAVDKAEGDQTRIAEINDEAAKKQSKAQIKAYGDMAQAAQGFFKKNTAGYKTMETVTKAFRAVEIAQQAMVFAYQLDGIAKTVVAFITGETTKAAAGAATVPAVVAAEKTKQNEYALTDIAAQGGIPIVGFALMAAMAAALAAFGIAGGGGSSVKGPTFADIENKGTGTVYGDPNAQSESISRSLDILTENSSNDLTYTADMLDALLAIKDALGGVTDLIAGTFMPLVDAVSGQFQSDSLKQAGFIFDAQKFMSVYKSGRITGSVGARFEWEDSSGFKHGRNLIQKYGKKYEQAFGEVVQSVADGLKLSGEKLGVSGETFMKRLEKFTINLGKVDIAGLSAEEAGKKIEAVFSKMSDELAMKALPEFKAFRQVGEGYAQTINRVAEGYTRAEGQLELLNMTIVELTDIEKKRGDVAAEAVRQTIMAQGDLSEGTRLYVKQLTGSSQEIIDAYKQILSITNLMRGAGFGTENIDRTMINAAGGLTAFEDALNSFRDNFMTDTQKFQADSEELSRAFGKLGIEMPKTKDEFYTIAMGMDRSTDAGKKLFAQFVLLSGQFSDLADAAQQLADDQYKLADDKYQAELDAHEKLVSGLKKNVDTAFSAMQKAYQDLQKVQDRFLSISKNLRSYLSELTGGTSQYSSPENRYRAAKAEFARLSALAAAGNESALGQLTSAGKTFLDASRDYNASSTQFQSDFAEVTRTIESSAAYAENQVDIAEQQLNIAESSYSQLKTLDTSVLSVRDAIGDLTAAMGKYADDLAALAAAPSAPVAPIKDPVVIKKPVTGTTPDTTTVTDVTTATNGYGYDAFGLRLPNPYGPFLPDTTSSLLDNTNLMGPFFPAPSSNNNAQLAQTMQSVATETKASVNVQQEAFSQMIEQLSSIDSRLSTMERTQRLSV